MKNHCDRYPNVSNVSMQFKLLSNDCVRSCFLSLRSPLILPFPSNEVISSGFEVLYYSYLLLAFLNEEGGDAFAKVFRLYDCKLFGLNITSQTHRSKSNMADMTSDKVEDALICSGWCRHNHAYSFPSSVQSYINEKIQQLGP